MKTAEGKVGSDGATARRRNGNARAVQQNEIRPGSLKISKAWASLPVSRATRQARVLADTLSAVGLSAAILSAAGHVLAANRLFTSLKREMVYERGGKPRFSDQGADEQISSALARLNREPHSAMPHAIPIRGSNGKPAAIAHLIAVRDDEAEILAGICGILIVVPLRSRSTLNPLILQRLFGLSPAEARVASGIAGRQTIEAIAENFGVSRETVRSQLKTVLAKTGTKRQLDLAVLLLGLQLPRA